MEAPQDTGDPFRTYRRLRLPPRTGTFFDGLGRLTPNPGTTMRRLLGLLLLFGLGCEQRADVGDLPEEQDGGARDGAILPGRPALEQLAAGDFAGARAGFEAGTTPGDAFGACFSRTMGLVEHSAVASTLSAFGLQPLRAADLLGPRSLPTRFAATWVGSGQIDVDGLNTRFDRARARRTDIEAFTTLGSGRLYFWEPNGVPTGPTRIDYRYDCSTGFLVAGPSQLTSRYSDDDRYCYQPTSIPTAGCDPDGGSVEILAAGSSNGAPYRLRYTNLLMTCSDRPVRASGEVNAQYLDVLDTAGLHPLIADLADGEETATTLGRTYVSALSAGTSAEQLLRPLYGLSGELETAAAACERAAQGAGVVFTIPGPLFGGSDLPVTAADAGVLAGLLRIGSAGLRIASAYQWRLPFAGWCTRTACIEPEVVADRFNTNLPTLTDRTALTTARTQLQAGLDRLAQSLAALSADSVVKRDANSTAGIERWRGWALTAKASVDQGATALDGFTPAVGIDLARLFTAPPQPDQAAADPLVVELGDLKLVEAFYDEVLGPYVDVTADGSVGYSGPPEAEALIDRVGAQLKAKGAILE